MAFSIENFPAMRPPPGSVSNFDNPETNATTLKAIDWIFVPLAVLMLCMRLSSRAAFKGEQGLGWDDLLMVLATMGSIAHATLVTIALNFGYGRHMWDMRLIDIKEQRLNVIMSLEPIYFVTMCLIKISILLLYKRFFGIFKSARILVYIGIAFVIIVTIPAFGVAVARSQQCDGIAALTAPLCETKKVSTGLTVFSVFNTLTDAYTLLIPINRILGLKIHMKKRLGLLGIFLGGLTATIMSIIRIAMVIVNSESKDQLYNASRVTPYTAVEMNLGIICSCMVFLPAFSQKAQEAARSLLGSRLGSSSGSATSFKTPESKLSQDGSEFSKDVEKADNSSLDNNSVSELPPVKKHSPL